MLGHHSLEHHGSSVEMTSMARTTVLCSSLVPRNEGPGRRTRNREPLTIGLTRTAAVARPALPSLTVEDDGKRPPMVDIEAQASGKRRLHDRADPELLELVTQVLVQAPREVSPCATGEAGLGSP